MKKIIDRMLFNTETAEEIHSYSNGYGYSDFHHLAETLYLTKLGAYFLHGEGGGLSKYAVRVGNGTCEGEEIVPMTKDEAYQWLESVDAVDAIEAHFPELVKDA